METRIDPAYAVHYALSSRQHAAVQRCRQLASARRPGDAVLLDGAHLLEEALAAGVRLELVLAVRGAVSSALLDAAEAAGARIYDATAAVLDAASPVRTPSGVVTAAFWAPGPPAAVFHTAPALVLGLVDVQDPGNAGAALRSADALGATGVLAIDATADPAGWKALRGAMGSTFRVPIARAPLADAAAAARAAHARVLAAVVSDGTPIDRVDLTGSICVLVGNEGAGLSPAAVDHADIRVTVPMRRGVNSLNVAVTAALLLYEAGRQRHPDGVEPGEHPQRAASARPARRR